MKKNICVRVAAAIAISTCAVPAHAGIPVFDVPNFLLNGLQIFELKKIRASLTDKGKDTVIHNTMNIDKSTTNISETNTSILEFNQKNYDIDADFTWIINNGSGDEIIPIPVKLVSKLEKIFGDKVSAEGYAQKYHDAQHYVTEAGLGDVASRELEGSRARKAANDMLVHAVEEEKAAMVGEVEAISKLAALNQKVRGSGHQLQLANAMAGSQINQLMKLRSTMLVAEAHRAAEAQAEADRDARTIAGSLKMRQGLDAAISAGKRTADVSP